MDLHGKTQDELFDILDPFLRKHENQPYVLLIVGKGKGLLKKKTVEYLKKVGYSWEYEKKGALVNKGALVVEMF